MAFWNRRKSFASVTQRHAHSALKPTLSWPHLIGLGVGESGNFPAGIRAVTDWFPQRERAFAIGLFNAGANVGAIITPLLVPALVLWFGWRAAFFLTGIFGVAWLVAWWVIYRHPAEHKRVTPAELAWIEQDPADPAAPELTHDALLWISRTTRAASAREHRGCSAMGRSAYPTATERGWSTSPVSQTATSRMPSPERWTPSRRSETSRSDPTGPMKDG